MSKLLHFDRNSKWILTKFKLIWGINIISNTFYQYIISNIKINVFLICNVGFKTNFTTNIKALNFYLHYFRSTYNYVYINIWRYKINNFFIILKSWYIDSRIKRIDFKKLLKIIILKFLNIIKDILSVWYFVIIGQLYYYRQLHKWEHTFWFYIS